MMTITLNQWVMINAGGYDW